MIFFAFSLKENKAILQQRPQTSKGIQDKNVNKNKEMEISKISRPSTTMSRGKESRKKKIIFKSKNLQPKKKKATKIKKKRAN